MSGPKYGISLKSISAPSMKSKNQGFGAMLAASLAQQKSQQGPATVPGAVPTSGSDPYNHINYKAPGDVEARNYTSDDIKTIGTAEAFKRHKRDILTALDKDPKRFSEAFGKATVNLPFISGKGKGNILGFPTTMGDELAINLNRSVGDISDRLLRLRSGAQINEGEFQRLSNLIPSYKDLSVSLGEDGKTTYPTIRKALDDFDLELGNARSRAIQGGFFKADEWGEPVGGIAPGTNINGTSVANTTTGAADTTDNPDPLEDELRNLYLKGE